MIEDRIPIRINVVIMNFENPNRANIIDIGIVVTIIAIVIEMMIVVFSRNDWILVFMIFVSIISPLKINKKTTTSSDVWPTWGLLDLTCRYHVGDCAEGIRTHIISDVIRITNHKI